MTDQQTPPPNVVYRRPVLHAPEIVNGAVVIAACICVTVLGMFRALDATVVSSVLVGAIAWAGGGAAGYRLGATRASDTHRPDGPPSL